MKKYMAALCLVVLLGCGPGQPLQVADITVTSKTKDMLRNYNEYYIVAGENMYMTDAENFYTMEVGKKYRIKWRRPMDQQPKRIYEYEGIE